LHAGGEWPVAALVLPRGRSFHIQNKGEITMRTLIAAGAAAALSLAACALASAETGTTPRTGYANVNGVKLYYEIHGSGEPMVLLHGGLGASGMFGEILPLLSKTRQVITVDLQAHGRTADTTAH
jgi:hypothetical protein